jgi:hypothetical protein
MDRAEERARLLVEQYRPLFREDPERLIERKGQVLLNLEGSFQATGKKVDRGRFDKAADVDILFNAAT